MKDFDGVIDSLELAIMNGKGIDHKRDLLQDLKEIREALEELSEIKRKCVSNCCVD